MDYFAIKFEIERKRCATHNGHPNVTINDGNDNIGLDCCCEDFQQICVDEIQELLAVQVQQSILDSFNKGLKGR